MSLDTSTERVRQLAEAIRLAPVTLKWSGDTAVRTFLALADERDALQEALERHREDRSYIIGWNDGYEHVTSKRDE